MHTYKDMKLLYEYEKITQKMKLITHGEQNGSL